MNKLNTLIQLFKKSNKHNKEQYDPAKLDEYTKEAYNALKRVLGDKAPSYKEVRESMERVGNKIAKKNGNK